MCLLTLDDFNGIKKSSFVIIILTKLDIQYHNVNTFLHDQFVDIFMYMIGFVFKVKIINNLY